MKIRYSAVDCPLGRLLVAAADRGLCTVGIGDSDEELLASLQREFAEAEIRPDRGELCGWAKAIVRYLEGEEPHLDLPLDLRGTAFQRRVWGELRKIPYGQTRTYAEVARAIGRPKAYRAVARACATNPVPLVIPCHRVVRSDGSLGGYGLGLDRKRALLEMERGRDEENEG